MRASTKPINQVHTATVLLLQDLALEGWKSMDLYAAQLKTYLPLVDDRYRVMAPSEYSSLSVSPILEKGKFTGLAHRLYARYVRYPAALRRYESDIVHILDHSYAHLLRGRDPRRAVITVHDLFPLRTIAQAGGSLRAWTRAALLRWVMSWCARAAFLIAVSDFTRQEISRLMGYPRERIRTIPPGVDERFFSPVATEEVAQLRIRLRLPHGPIVLHVGSCVTRKNICALFSVLARLRAQDHDAHLLQVGGNFTPAQLAEIQRLGLNAHITQLSHVPDEELPVIYRLADLLLFPSSYEGFGLPLIEAMACGTAVVAARAASIPEVVGDVALLEEPDDWDGLAGAAHRVITEKSLRAELGMRGRERAARFSWLTTARKVVAVYDELLSVNSQNF